MVTIDDALTPKGIRDLTGWEAVVYDRIQARELHQSPVAFMEAVRLFPDEVRTVYARDEMKRLIGHFETAHGVFAYMGGLATVDECLRASETARLFSSSYLVRTYPSS